MAKLKLRTIPNDKPVKLTIELPAAIHRDLVAHERDEPADGRIFGVGTPSKFDVHPGVLLPDRPIHDAREHDLGLASRREGDSESGSDRCEHAPLAHGVGVEPDATAHERCIELARGLTVVSALNEEDFLPQALPIDNLLLRERMVARNRRDLPFALEWRWRGVRPERMARHQCDVDTTLLNRSLGLLFVHFRNREHDRGRNVEADEQPALSVEASGHSSVSLQPVVPPVLPRLLGYCSQVGDRA
jgi:hypothetical protein